MYKTDIMKTLSTTEAREQLSELVSRVAFAREAVIFSRHGKPMAALVPLDALEKLQAMGMFVPKAKATEPRTRAGGRDTIEEMRQPRRK